MDNILLAGIVGIFGMILYFYFQDAEITKEDKIRKLKSDLKYWRYERSKSLSITYKQNNVTKIELEFAEDHIKECNEKIDFILLELQKCSKE